MRTAYAAPHTRQPARGNLRASHLSRRATCVNFVKCYSRTAHAEPRTRRRVSGKLHAATCVILPWKGLVSRPRYSPLQGHMKRQRSPTFALHCSLCIVILRRWLSPPLTWILTELKGAICAACILHGHGLYNTIMFIWRGSVGLRWQNSAGAEPKRENLTNAINRHLARCKQVIKLRNKVQCNLKFALYVKSNFSKSATQSICSEGCESGVENDHEGSTSAVYG